MGAETEVTDGLSSELSRLARTLQSQQVMDLDSDRLLLEVTETATQLLPKVTHGGVTLVVNRRRRTVVNRPGFHAPSGFCDPAGLPVTSWE
ncbi:hypothetical protein ACJH6J_22030, partial [Mycobacterium sp. SMC-18]